MSVSEWLRQPYPGFTQPLRDGLLIAGVGGVVTMILLIARPFGLATLPGPQTQSFILATGSVAISIALAVGVFLPMAWKSPFRESESKFLIFTEFRDTQEYIYDNFDNDDFNAVKFNGSMSTSDRDLAVNKFQKNSQIMIATEAGGEGKNFQFCHNVVNYDLPWNPMKIEQRVGRVHRIGQDEDVIIHNFSIKDTIEEYVLKLLYEKINLFKMTIGELDLLFEDSELHNIENRIFESYISSNTKQEITNKFSALGKEWGKGKTKIEETMNEFNPEVFSNFKLSAMEDM